MAVKNLDMLVEKLIRNGKSPETPVAVVRWGTRPDQKTIVSTLRDIVSDVKGHEIKPPAVVVIGEVVKLRDTLKWYEDKPMFGQRILVTREHSTGFEPLEELGAEVLEFPTIEIAPPETYDDLDSAIAQIHLYTWIVFTSGNGVRYFLKRFFEKERDIRDLKGIRICAIGTKTAAEVKKYGMRVDLVPEEFRAEGLIEAFTPPNPPLAKGGDGGVDSKARTLHSELLKGLKFLLPRAETAREIFPEKVRELGGEIDVPVTYRTVKPEIHGRRLKRFLKEGRITIATFTSAATFNNFVDIIGSDAFDLLKGVSIAVIGPVTARAVEKAGLKVDIMPKEATIEAMVEEIIKRKAKREA
jgi:uroporphyrinogen III methyltransferase/synthase